MSIAYDQRPWLKWYREGVKADVTIHNQSLCQAFDEATDKWKDKTAIIFYGRKISFKEIREKADRVAAALHDLGVRKGDVVAFLLLNSPEFIIAYYGTLKTGAIISPISPVYVSSEIKHQLEDSGAKAIVCQDILLEKVEKTGVKLKTVILTNIGESLPASTRILGQSVLKIVYQKMAVPSRSIAMKEGFYQLQDLLKKYSPNPPAVDINATEDIAVLPYTGGTTGLPKGVMLTHSNLTSNVEMIEGFYPLEQSKEVMLSFMPFFHIGGMIWEVVTAIFRGWTQIILTTPALDDIISNIRNYNVTFFGGAPTIFEMLKNYDKTKSIDWRSMKVVASGADALHEATAKDWELQTGTKLHDFYGSTEQGGSSMWSPYGKPRYGSIGVPLPNVQAAVVEPGKDELVEVGEIGEIVVRGPHICKGYWKRPDAVKETEAIVNGITWFRTGDLGKMDEDGYFYIYDRVRDLIKYKGYRVHSREVEEVIKMNPSVKEVGVIGLPDQQVGENIKAFVVLETDARGKVTETAIVEYCQDKLAHYKIPRIIEFVSELPKTDVGKVSRRELREMEE
jgi:long-chain acyl-CoA synthetase